MKTTMCLLTLAVVTIAPCRAGADALTLHPTSVVHSTDNATTYVQFDLPTTLQDATILHATVSYESACTEGEIGVLAYEVQEEWNGEASALSDLLSDDQFINKGNPMSFDAPDCEVNRASLDISHVARAWQKGIRINRGMVITTEPFTRATQPESEDITITILYRLHRDTR